MKKHKSALISVLLLVSLCVFSGCRRNERVDYSELLRRLGHENKTCSFEEKEIFFNNGVYYAYGRAASEDDLLLTMREDPLKKLDRVTLTVSAAENKEEAGRIFLALTEALIRSFVPENEEQELMKAAREYGGVLFGEELQSTESGRFSLSFFSDPLGASFIIERK